MADHGDTDRDPRPTGITFDQMGFWLLVGLCSVGYLAVLVRFFLHWLHNPS